MTLKGKRILSLRTFALTAVLLAAQPIFAEEAAPASYDLNRALREFADLSLLQHPADPPRRFAQLSSWDRNLGNFDQGNFLRSEGFEEVLMDVQGPGVLTRLWTAEPMGILRFYWDGATEPQLVVRWQDLQKGAASPLEEPFVSSRGGGCTMRFPLPFEKGLKITLSEQTWPHWQIHYQYFAPDVSVKSWWPDMGPPPGAPELYTDAARLFEDPVRNVKLPGDINKTQEVVFSASQPTFTFSPSDHVMMTEIAVAQKGHAPLPEGFEIEIVQNGRRTIRLPWRSFAGVWETMADSPSILQGRMGPITWNRVPFLLTPEDSIRFHYAGGEAFEAAVMLTMSERAPEGAHPRLVVLNEQQQVGGGARYVAEELRGRGRLLSVATRAHATGNPYYMEGDEMIFLEGEEQPSIRGTGMEDLFDSAWYFMNKEFATAIAAAPLVGPGWLETAARVSWWPLGIPYAESLRFELQGGAFDDAPPTLHNLVLVGQVFDEATQVPPPGEEEPVLARDLFGSRVITGTDQAGLPIYREFTAPLTAQSRPYESWLNPGESLSGTFDVTLSSGDVEYFAARLDLPFGWRGRLVGMGEDKEVYDIGWPPVERWQIEPGTYHFTWTATPPPVVHLGNHIVQLRTEVRLPDGTDYAVAHPVKVYATPNAEAEIEWTTQTLTQIAPREYHLPFPKDFHSPAGDMIAVEVEATAPDAPHQGEARLLFSPHGPSNVDSLYEEVVGLLPPPGSASGRILFGGEPHWVVFPVGRTQSWLAGPEEALISFDQYPSGEFTVRGARLYRHPPYPNAEGHSIRRPYKEMARGSFRPPEGLKFLLEGVELGRSITRDVATPQDRLNPEFRPTVYLENVEAAPLKWRIAEPARREGPPRPPSPGYLFPSRYVGERIRITNEQIRGAKRIGIQFGYGPWCGTVGVRDCEGRLVGVHELYMNRPATFPQYLEIDLPVASRDPYLFLEALAPTPGGHELRIPIQKLMIFNDTPQISLGAE